MWTRRDLILAFGPLAAWNARAQDTPAVARQEIPLDPADLPELNPSSLIPKLEPAKSFVLSNGVRVAPVGRHTAQRADFLLRFDASPIDDPPELNGLAEAAAELMPLSRPAASEPTLAEYLARSGSTLKANARYGADRTELLLETFGRDGGWDALSATLRVINGGLVADQEFDLWRKAKQIELTQRMRGPRYGVERELRRMLYAGEHDRRSIISSSPESLARVSAADVMSFRRRHYRPASAVLGMCSITPPKQAARSLEQSMKSWTPGAASPPVSAAGALNPETPRDEPITVVHASNSGSVQLSIGCRAFDRFSPDYEAGVLLSRILGYGPTSRLYRKLRMERGYAYDVFAGFSATRFLSHFTATTTVGTEHTREATAVILDECRRLQDSIATSAEITAAKLRIAGSFLTECDDPGQWLWMATDILTYNLGPRYWRDYMTRITAVSPEEIRTAARRYLPGSHPVIVATGDAKLVAPALEPFGPVRVVSAAPA